MLTVDEFALQFDEEPGYLDFGRIGPLARVVVEEERAHLELMRTARFGSLDPLWEDAVDSRLQSAVSALTGFGRQQIVFQPNTSLGLMEVMFGLCGDVLLSAQEFPSAAFAAVRASNSIGLLRLHWLQTDGGRVTPEALKQQLTPEVTAVVVSLVDFRTGYLADLAGIRQVIGDRLLIVDAIQGFTVADVDYRLADVVVSGGQKWVRAGWGTGFMALSDRAIERIQPVLSGFNATDEGNVPVGRVPHPSGGARAFQVTNPSPIAQLSFAAALEQIAEVGVAQIAERVRDNANQVIELADEFGVPVSSPRDEGERAGIVVLQPPSGHLTALAAALRNNGLTVTVREDNVRISTHVSTTQETFAMLRVALQQHASTAKH